MFQRETNAVLLSARDICGEVMVSLFRCSKFSCTINTEHIQHCSPEQNPSFNSLLITMQLLSPSNSIHDATFASSDGSISYSFQTSGWPSRKTQISKLGRALGKVQLHSYSLDEVIVNDREIKVEKTGMMSRSAVLFCTIVK